MYTATESTDTLPGVEIRVADHYEGPPGITNGGWACGLTAGLLTGPGPAHGMAVEVTLRAPVPLRTPLRGERTGDSAFLTAPSGVLAEARVLPGDEAAALPAPPAFLPVAEARRAGAPEVCLRTPFPTCYVCGSERAGGLRITVGRVTGDERAGGVWTPPTTFGDLPARYLWAALDCPTGLVHLTDGGKALLGRLTVTTRRTPVPGEPLVVVAATTGADRRKRFATAALYTPGGDVVAHSVATWITI